MAWLISNALMQDYESSLCSQGQGEESLGDTCSDGEQSAQSNLTPTPQAYCAPDKTTEFLRLFLFGMTFAPLTESHGEELLTWYLAGFHAKTYPLPERALESAESVADCGRTWPGLLAKYDHDSCSWKTVQLSLLGDSDECSVTWPRWGMTQGGAAYQLPTAALGTNATVSGLLPTLTVCGNYNRKGASATSGDGLATALKKWPTLTCQDAKNNGAPSQMERNTKPLNAEVGGPLNPEWCEWFMGFPVGWTELKPLEMHKFQSWQQQHGKF